MGKAVTQQQKLREANQKSSLLDILFSFFTQPEIAPVMDLFDLKGIIF